MSDLEKIPEYHTGRNNRARRKTETEERRNDVAIRKEP